MSNNKGHINFVSRVMNWCVLYQTFKQSSPLKTNQIAGFDTYLLSNRLEYIAHARA